MDLIKSGRGKTVLAGVRMCSCQTSLVAVMVQIPRCVCSCFTLTDVHKDQSLKRLPVTGLEQQHTP